MRQRQQGGVWNPNPVPQVQCCTLALLWLGVRSTECMLDMDGMKHGRHERELSQSRNIFLL